MKAIPPKIQNLLDKLKLTEEIYKKVSSKIPVDLLIEQFQSLAEKKRQQLEEIGDRLGIEVGSHYLDLPHRIMLELEKARLELDYLVDNSHEKAALDFCISNEEDLVESYKQLVDDQTYDEFVRAMFHSQMEDTVRARNELQETREHSIF